MSSTDADDTAFGLSNQADRKTFGFPNISRLRETLRARRVAAESGRDSGPVPRLWVWRRHLPLTAKVPIVAGALMLVVAVVVSHAMMSTVIQEQERGLRRLAAVYLDGISTTIYPHVVARNLVNTTEALHRTMWFHQSMREQRALVVLPNGSLFADVSGPDADAEAPDPYHDLQLRRRLEQGDGLVFDTNAGTGWASRTIVHDGNHVAGIYVGLELKPLIQERRDLHEELLVATVLAGLGAALVGFVVVRRMVSPVQALTERLRRAGAGDFSRVPACWLPSAASEFGQLLRGYNDLVGALEEREAMAVRLAERERESVLGRLAATVAHEVHNPLGGIATAVNTVRKFGHDPDVRAKGLDLIERGLLSIRDVVDSVLAFHRMPSDGRSLTPNDLEDLRVLIGPEVARRDLTLSWHCAISTTIAVAATETRQIALNLLLNACEASSAEDEISFRAQMSHTTGPTEGVALRIEVADSGPGLPQAVKTMLTEFGTADPSDVPRGLGIRVVRDLVRGLGGRILATAGDGDRGSRIVVLLPTKDPAMKIAHA
jgi:two-component system OmpR family sensor kinase